ncbi:MAG: hypothetical protein IPL79_07535 [Myxococcales bacterium]|nr:hypothetical protein [Myxococcales bacterium]
MSIVRISLASLVVACSSTQSRPTSAVGSEVLVADRSGESPATLPSPEPITDTLSATPDAAPSVDANWPVIRLGRNGIHGLSAGDHADASIVGAALAPFQVETEDPECVTAKRKPVRNLVVGPFTISIVGKAMVKLVASNHAARVVTPDDVSTSSTLAEVLDRGLSCKWFDDEEPLVECRRKGSRYTSCIRHRQSPPTATMARGRRKKNFAPGRAVTA